MKDRSLNLLNDIIFPKITLLFSNQPPISGKTILYKFPFKSEAQTAQRPAQNGSHPPFSAWERNISGNAPRPEIISTTSPRSGLGKVRKGRVCKGKRGAGLKILLIFWIGEKSAQIFVDEPFLYDN